MNWVDIILKNTVNPWTILFFVVFILFRKEIKNIIGLISHLIGDISRLKISSFEFTREKLMEAAKSASSLSKSQIGTIVRDEKEIDRVYENLENISETLAKIDTEDIEVLITLFEKEDRAVVEKGSKYEKYLEKLARSDLLRKETELKGYSTFGSKRINLWTITSKGLVIKHLVTGVG